MKKIMDILVEINTCNSMGLWKNIHTKEPHKLKVLFLLGLVFPIEWL